MPLSTVCFALLRGSRLLPVSSRVDYFISSWRNAFLFLWPTIMN